MSINENDEITGSWIKHTNDINEDLWQEDFEMNGRQFVKRNMMYKNAIPNASAVVFSKKAYLDSGECNTKFTINGDWDLYTRILANTNIFFLHQPLNYFRQHSAKGSSINISNGNNIKEYYWLAKQWIKNDSLTKNEQRNLLDHIYKIWQSQVRSKSKNLLGHRFIKIFPSAFNIDKKIIFKILSTLNQNSFYPLK